MNTKERLKMYCKENKISVATFEKSICVSNGYVNSISKGIGQDKQMAILEKYPNLSLEWLLTGNGTMLRQAQQPAPVAPSAPPPSALPLIPVSAVATFSSAPPGTYPSYLIPDFISAGAHFLYRVSGNTMAPRYLSGDLLACRIVNKASFLQPDKFYLIHGPQGAMVGRLQPQGTNSFICHSVATSSPFTITVREVLSLSLVVGIVRLE